MPPSSLLPIESDRRTTVDIAAGTLLQGLPCLRCTLIGLTCLIVVVFLVRLLSPTRLCGTMKNSLNVAERVYHGSALAGMLNPSFQLEIGESLRRYVFNTSVDFGPYIDCLPRLQPAMQSLACRRTAGPKLPSALVYDIGHVYRSFFRDHRVHMGYPDTQKSNRGSYSQLDLCDKF
jgi:hypothetical protein